MKQILVTTDFSEESKRAFEHAKMQANLAGADKSQIHLLSILEDFAPHSVGFGFGFATIDSKGFLDRALRSAEEQIKKISKEQFSGYKTSASVVRAQYDAPKEIAEYAKKHKIDLAVMATHGYGGFKRFMLGSVTEAVIHQISCPVLVVPIEEIHKDERDSIVELRPHIAVATDFSECAKRAYAVAHEQFQLQKEGKVQLTLVHISEDLSRATYGVGLGEDHEQIRQDIETKSWQELDAVRSQYFPGDIADTVVIRAELNPALELVTYANNHHVDLLVMATHGRSGLGHFVLGSVAERVIRLAKRPVLVVPAKD